MTAIPPLPVSLSPPHVWTYREHQQSSRHWTYLSCRLSLFISGPFHPQFFTYLDEMSWSKLNHSHCEKMNGRVNAFMYPVWSNYRRKGCDVEWETLLKFVVGCQIVFPPLSPPPIFDTSLWFPASCNWRAFEVQLQACHTRISYLSPHRPASGKSHGLNSWMGSAGRRSWDCRLHIDRTLELLFWSFFPSYDMQDTVFLLACALLCLLLLFLLKAGAYLHTMQTMVDN